MLTIKYHKRVKNKLEKQHLNGLGQIIRDRVLFAIAVISNLNHGKIEVIIDNFNAIEKRTKTALLNEFIGLETDFARADQWPEFNNKARIRPGILTFKKEIVDYLKKITPAKIKQILLSPPAKLDKLAEDFVSSSRSINKELNAIYATIFDYDAFAKSNDYNPFKLIETTKITSCPYCNINRIVTNRIAITHQQEIEGLRSELDHYFSKTGRPILALSLYNLIPSCLDCNLRLKGTKPFTISNFLHPYIDGFDEKDNESPKERVSFSYRFDGTNTSAKGALQLQAGDISIEIKFDKVSATKKTKLVTPDPLRLDLGNITVFEHLSSYNHQDARNVAHTILTFLQDSNTEAYVRSLSWFYRKFDKKPVNEYYKTMLTLDSWKSSTHISRNYAKFKKDVLVQFLKDKGITIT